MRTLLVQRRGVLFEGEWVGPAMELPAQPTASSLGLTPESVDQLASLVADPDALALRLGLDRTCAQFGRIDVIRTFGLHDPTPWERLVSAWVARRLGASDPLLGGEPATGPLADMGAVLADPIARWPDVPPAGLALLHGDDPDLEALGATRWLREQLMAADSDVWSAWVEGVLILVPNDVSRLATWRARLEEAGLPVRSRGWESIADTPIGRWALALASLAGGDERPVSCAALHVVFDAPLYSMPDGGRRSDLRAILRELRRPTITFPRLRSHASAWFNRRLDALKDRQDTDGDERAAEQADLTTRADAIDTLLAWVAAALGSDDTATLWLALRRLLDNDRLKVQLRVGATKRPELITALAIVVESLDDLSRTPGSGSGAAVGGATAGRSPASTLGEALSSAGRGLRSRPQQGVCLQTWSTWDGSGGHHVVLAGLEEGGFPRPPGPLGATDRRLVDELKLGTASSELQRQARVVARALASTDQAALLSWSMTDSQGSETFPGAFLAGCPSNSGDRGPRAVAWRAVTRHVAERDLAPMDLSQAWSPADARLLVKPPSLTDELWEQAERAAEHARAVERARAPTEPNVAVGPWTGLIGSPVPEQAWSPTSLEDLGQCATKFFLGRLLRAQRDEDMGSLLDARESGSLVHDSLATAALTAIAKDGAWRLQPRQDEDASAYAAARADEAEESMAGHVALLAARHPTLGVGITRWTAYRWQRAIRGALRKESVSHRGGALGDHLPRVEDLDDRGLDVVAELGSKATTAVNSFRKLRGERESATKLIAALVAERITVKARAEAYARELEPGGLPILTGTAIKAATSKDGVDGQRLTEIVAQKLDDAGRKLEAHLKAAFELDRIAVARDVVAAEWSFGLQAGGGPLDRNSVAEPLPVPVHEGPPLLVKGRVDRVDGDARTSRLSIVDYKSGTEKAGSRLLALFGEGRHLQLPVYGRAASELLTPKLGWTRKAVVMAGRLQFTRSRKEANLDLEGLRLLPAHDAGTADHVETVITALTGDQVLEAHLSHSAGRLRSGVLPLAPRACPLRSDPDAHCGFERCCGFSPSAKPLLDDDAQPRFEAKSKTPGEPKAPPAFRPLALLRPAAEPPSAEHARDRHTKTLAAVKDLSRDLVVSAGAGSGKTTQLVERYVEAVKAGHAPDEILAITFTRKATAEMRTRVRARLLQGGLGLSEDAVRAAVLALGSAPILTIDAFAARVVQALDVGASGELRVAAGSERFVEGWLDAKMVTACDHPGGDLTHLLKALPLGEIQAQLLPYLTMDRERLASLARLDADALVARWTTALELAWPELQRDMSVFEGLSATVLVEPNTLTEDVTAGLKRARSLVAASGSLGFLAAMSGLKCGPKLKEPAPEDARKAILELKSRWQKDDAPTAALAKRLCDALKPPTGPKDELPLDGGIAALRTAVLAEAETSLAALRVAAAWRPELEDARSQLAVVGFDDVVAKATELLKAAALAPGAAGEVRAQLPYAHVFVDELQDTNRAQIALLEALSAALSSTGRAPRLFLVGDVKQSIYRFRGAEVDVFLAETRRTDRTSTTLDACWRAQPSLTRSVDRLFGRLLEPEYAAGGFADPLARVPWEPLAPRWGTEGAREDEEAGPCFELLRARIDSTDGVDTAATSEPEPDEATTEREPDEATSGPEDEELPDEADDGDGAVVVDRIKQLRLEHPDWTIAVLTHSWALATRWADTLRQAQVPAFIQGGRGLLSDPAVAPMVAMLDALEREDDLGLLEVLRGPLIGVSDAGLWAIRNGRGVTLPNFGNDELRAMPARLPLSRLRHGFTFDATAAIAWLEAEGKQPPTVDLREALYRDAERIAAWTPWWSEARASFGLDPVDRTVAGIVAASGYRRTLQGDGGDAARTRLAALRRFEQLLHGLAENGDGAAASVARELRRMTADSDDPSAASNPYMGDAVTVTVVHQAKGLAWDVVVLPALKSATVRSRVDSLAPVRVLDAGGARVDLPYVRVTKAEDPFSLERGIASLLAKTASDPWERAEQRRLLYVACTRARERVVLAGGLPATFGEARKLLVKLSKRSPADAPSHRVSYSWLEDVIVALGLEATDPASTQGDTGEAAEPGRWSLGQDGWVEGRDYRWVTPDVTPVVSQVRAELPPPPDLARRLGVVTSQPLDVRNPSRASGGGVPKAMQEVAPVGTDPKLDHPFRSARLAGTIAHRAFATWAWRDLPVGQLAEAAIREELPERTVTADAVARSLPGQVSWVSEILRVAEVRQPVLARELRLAALRGDVVHEARVHVNLHGARIEGSIDLLWRDLGGLWHLLDYKVTGADEVSEESLERRVAHYYPQVALYADSIQGRLGGGAERLATYGLWFVKEGRVVRWAAT